MKSKLNEKQASNTFQRNNDIWTVLFEKRCISSSSIDRTNTKRKCNNKTRTEMQTFFFQGGSKTNVNNWQTRIHTCVRIFARTQTHAWAPTFERCVKCDSSKFLCLFSSLSYFFRQRVCVWFFSSLCLSWGALWLSTTLQNTYVTRANIVVRFH